MFSRFQSSILCLVDFTTAEEGGRGGPPLARVPSSCGKWLAREANMTEAREADASGPAIAAWTKVQATIARLLPCFPFRRIVSLYVAASVASSASPAFNQTVSLLTRIKHYKSATLIGSCCL